MENGERRRTIIDRPNERMEKKIIYNRVFRDKMLMEKVSVLFALVSVRLMVVHVACVWCFNFIKHIYACTLYSMQYAPLHIETKPKDRMHAHKILFDRISILFVFG